MLIIPHNVFKELLGSSSIDKHASCWCLKRFIVSSSFLWVQGNPSDGYTSFTVKAVVTNDISI